MLISKRLFWGVPLLSVLIIFFAPIPVLGGSEELIFGYNQDYGLMAGAYIHLDENPLPIPADLSIGAEIFTQKFNLFTTLFFPWEEKFGFYTRSGVADYPYFGAGAKFMLSWDLDLYLGIGISWSKNTFLDLLADYQFSKNLALKIRYNYFKGYIGIGYSL